MIEETGNAHAGSATATGVKGEDLGPVNVAYRLAPNGTLLTAAPVNAGSYLVAGRFAGNNNYNQKQSDAASLIINQATLTASIIGDPTRPYNGNTNATLTFGNFSGTKFVEIIQPTWNSSHSPNSHKPTVRDVSMIRVCRWFQDVRQSGADVSAYSASKNLPEKCGIIGTN